MPNKIEDFYGWRIFDYVYRKLKTIRRANGYNTDPKVTYDYHEAKESNAKHTLWIEVERHSIDSHAIGGGTNGVPSARPVIELNIAGWCKPESEPYRRAAMALEQDVRNSLHAMAQTITTDLAKGIVFRFGRCEHDAGILAPIKEAGFELSCSLMYPQRKDW